MRPTSEQELFEQADQRYDWCLKHFGPAQDYPPRWQPGELGHPLKFRFRDPRDELLFKIQWA
jgi:hypothetical protein